MDSKHICDELHQSWKIIYISLMAAGFIIGVPLDILFVGCIIGGSFIITGYPKTYYLLLLVAFALICSTLFIVHIAFKNHIAVNHSLISSEIYTAWAFVTLFAYHPIFLIALAVLITAFITFPKSIREGPPAKSRWGQVGLGLLFSTLRITAGIILLSSFYVFLEIRFKDQEATIDEGLSRPAIVKKALQEVSALYLYRNMFANSVVDRVKEYILQEAVGFRTYIWEKFAEICVLPPELNARVIEETKTMTESEKVNYILHWLSLNYEYDYERLRALEAEEDTGERTLYFAPIYEIIDKKKGICWDYARIFDSMARAVGLRTAIIKGDMIAGPNDDRIYTNIPGSELVNYGPHAWNTVKIGNNWFVLEPQTHNLQDAHNDAKVYIPKSVLNLQDFLYVDIKKPGEEAGGDKKHPFLQ